MPPLPPKTILWINRNFRTITTVFAVLIAVLGYFVVLRSLSTTVFRVELTSIQTLKDQRSQQAAKLKRAQEFLAKYNALSAEDRDRLIRILPTKAEIPVLFSQLPALVSDAGLELTNLSFAEGAETTISPTGAPLINISSNTNSTPSAPAPSGNVNAAPTEASNTNTAANVNAPANTNAAADLPRPFTVAGKTLHNVSVALDISGGKTYGDLKKFLDAVERNLRVLDIVSISFNTIQPGPNPAGGTEAAPATSSDEVQIPSYSVALQTYYFTP